MQNCQVCGRSFDPFTFQIVVPELGRGFDRIECARTARSLGPPTAGLALAPVVAVVEPVGAAAGPFAGAAKALRPLVGAPVAALGLLAAGSAASAYLWMGVLGADTTGVPASAAAAPPASESETVEADVPAAPTEPTEPTRTVPAAKPAPRPTPEAVAALVGARGANGSRPSSGGGKPTKAPAGPTFFGRPAGGTVEEPAPARAAGDGGAKRGKGHFKHGEADGTHRPGHGRAHGKKKGH